MSAASNRAGWPGPQAPPTEGLRGSSFLPACLGALSSAGKPLDRAVLRELQAEALEGGSKEGADPGPQSQVLARWENASVSRI